MFLKAQSGGGNKEKTCPINHGKRAIFPSPGPLGCLLMPLLDLLILGGQKVSLQRIRDFKNLPLPTACKWHFTSSSSM